MLQEIDVLRDELAEEVLLYEQFLEGNGEDLLNSLFFQIRLI